MADTNHITKEYLHEIFEYKDGELYWKVQYSNRAPIGTKIANPNKQGYLRVNINGKKYLAHRIIFMMFHGYIPKIIDHKNHIVSDNRIENLREATPSQNAYNMKTPSNNTSGVKGIKYRKDCNKWQVVCHVDKKPIYLGVYKNIEDAKNVLFAFRKEQHKEFSRV